MVTVSITGHRPEAIDDMVWVRTAIKQAYADMEAEKIIQGMAAGVDLWSAAEAWNSKIPFVAARPWATHTARIADRKAYEWVLANAIEVVNVSEADTFPGNFIYHTRNKYMVDNADAVLAVWDGSLKGGTYACFQYAVQQEKPIYRIDPKRKIVHGWINK
jgi:uncharacterized phage-like protein YoqJ